MNKIDNIIDKYAHKAGSLISILQAVQVQEGFISQEAVAQIAKKTGIAAARIEGVASFYSQFRTTPIGKHHILFCLGTACFVNGGKDVFNAVKDFLAIDDGGTTTDGLFTLDGVACLGCCSLAPAMMIGSQVYGNLTAVKAVEIIKGLK